jgi:hypothetical protein
MICSCMSCGNERYGIVAKSNSFDNVAQAGIDTAIALLEAMRDSGAFDKRAANAVKRILAELEGGTDEPAPNDEDAKARAQLVAAAPLLSSAERGAIMDPKLTSLATAAYMSAHPAATQPGTPAISTPTASGCTDHSGRGDELDRIAQVGNYSPSAKRAVVFDGTNQVFGVPVAQ